MKLWPSEMNTKKSACNRKWQGRASEARCYRFYMLMNDYPMAEDFGAENVWDKITIQNLLMDKAFFEESFLLNSIQFG